jgi:hypothetical protein
MRTWSDDELLDLAKTVNLVTIVTKMDGTESFNIVAPNANTQDVLAFARRLLETETA